MMPEPPAAQFATHLRAVCTSTWARLARIARYARHRRLYDLRYALYSDPSHSGRWLTIQSAGCKSLMVEWKAGRKAAWKKWENNARSERPLDARRSDDLVGVCHRLGHCGRLAIRSRPYRDSATSQTQCATSTRKPLHAFQGTEQRRRIEASSIAAPLSASSDHSEASRSRDTTSSQQPRLAAMAAKLLQPPTRLLDIRIEAL